MNIGEKMKQYRKQNGLSQEQLAELLFVSRAAVAKWENQNGLPDIENLKKLSEVMQISIDELMTDSERKQPESTKLSHLPWLWIGISLLSILLYTMFCVGQGSFSVGTLVCVIVLAVPIQLFMHVYFCHAVKSHDFTGIAGFQEKTEYQITEVAALLQRIDMLLGAQTSIYIILMCIVSTGKFGWLVGVLLFFYIFEFIWTVIYLNYKCIDKIYVHEEEKRKAKEAFPLTMTYLFVLMLGVGLLYLLFEWKGVKNNTLPALQLTGWCLLGIGVATVGLLIRKKGSWWCMIIALVTYVLMFLTAKAF